MKSLSITIGVTLRRFLAVSLSIVMIVMFAFPAFAAESATASDMRLERTEGTVTLQNANGKTMTIREGMKLYSGYTVTTEAASYAYISLDNDKVVKLDAGSQVEIRKQGNKLEVLLHSGELFFNVKAPVAKDQSLNIRTSTMVTGIRGTSGYISVLDATRTAVTVLDGAVDVTTPNTGEYQNFETVTVTAGLTGIAMDHVTDEHWQVVFQDLKKEDIPGYVLIELASDAQLCQRIAEDTDLPLEELISGAQDRLLADEQAYQEAQEALEEDAASLKNGGVNSAPPFQYEEPAAPEQTPAEDGGGIFDIPSLPSVPTTPTAPTEPSTPTTPTEPTEPSTPTTPTEPTEPSTPTTPTEPTEPSTPTTPTEPSTPSSTGTITLTKKLVDGSGADLKAVGNKTYSFTITGASAGTQTATITVSDGASEGATIISGLAQDTYTVTETEPTGDTFTSGVVTYTYASNSGSGTVTIAAESLDQSVTITNTYTKPDTYTVTDTTITGAQLNDYLANYNTVIFGSNGELNVASGEQVTIASGKTVQVENLGSFVNNGTIENNGTFTDYSYSNGTGWGNFGAFVNNGTFEARGTFANAGTFTVSSGSIAKVIGTFNNDGVLDILGNMTIEAGAYGYLTNDSTITIKSGGVLVNTVSSSSKEGTPGINNTGNFVIEAGGTLTNQGDFYNGNGDTEPGTFTNSGTVTSSVYFANFEQSIISNSKDFTSTGTIENRGTITNSMNFGNRGTFTNSGTITDTSAGASNCFIHLGGSFENALGGQINVNGYVVMMYNMTNNGTITVSSGSTLTLQGSGNAYTLTNNGTISNSGTISVKNPCTITGTISGNQPSYFN